MYTYIYTRILYIYVHIALRLRRTWGTCCAAWCVEHMRDCHFALADELPNSRPSLSRASGVTRITFFSPARRRLIIRRTVDGETFFLSLSLLCSATRSEGRLVTLLLGTSSSSSSNFAGPRQNWPRCQSSASLSLTAFVLALALIDQLLLEEKHSAMAAVSLQSR